MFNKSKEEKAHLILMQIYYKLDSK